MLVLVPSDAPTELLRALAAAAPRRALLRRPTLPPWPLRARFPLLVPPEAISGGPDAVLVTPDYAWIRWAKARGLRAVWYNPKGAFAPEPHPLHDWELRSPQEVPSAWDFPLPDLGECLRILREQGVPEGVVAHSAAVAAVAHFLAERLRARGVAVDPLLVHRGGLLHDLDKIAALNEGGEHGLRAAETLAALGYPELGRIAQAHVLAPGRLPTSWPEKLVFLADKLVEGAEVVGLEARLSALRARYPEFQERIAAAEPFVRTLQNQVLVALGMSEAELLEALRALPLGLPLGPGPEPGG
ncbi:MAG: HDIG domain-containing metalloprotein [Candidatus Bipolaricaulaceae bacterium]